MDSQSSTGPASTSSFVLPTASLPLLDSIPPAELFFAKQTWLQVAHLPSRRKRVSQSRIWVHGTDYVSVSDPSIHAWRCNHCVRDYLVCHPASSTSNAKRHLLTKHGITLDTSLTLKRSREEAEGEEGEEVEVRDSPQVKGLLQSVNIDTFRYYLVRWVVECRLPFIVVEDASFQAMLKSLNVSMKDYLVKSGDTVRTWVEDDFINAKEVVKEEVLARSLSKIHISCDLWTSTNGYALYGIAAHFVGHQGRIQSVLIALRRMRAGYDGEQLAEVILTVVKEYGIAEKLGVFIGDNASSNDAAWKHVLSALYPERDPVASRSRCLGHIINLAAKAFIFGKSTEAFEATIDAVNDSTPRDSEIMRKAQDAWRKKGPLGKMRNIITYIRCSPQRREAFRRVVVDEVGDNMMVILDNSTQWNSTFLSLQRALLLRKRIELFCFEYRADLSKDMLSDDDWILLNNIVEGLQPFHEVTLRLQGQARSTQFGAIWEALPALGILLETMEQGRATFQEARGAKDPITIAYQNAWEKLQKYYELTDDAHSIYAAAVLLHPSHRKAYFNTHWVSDVEVQWKDLMIQNVKNTWEREYRPLSTLSYLQPDQEHYQKEQSLMDKYLHRAQVMTTDNAFDSYIQSPIVHFGSIDAVIPWVRTQANLSPAIQQQVFDLLSIPAMSTELERVFSQSKLTVTPLRNSLSAETIETLELMRYWWSNNIISQRRGGGRQ